MKKNRFIPIIALFIIFLAAIIYKKEILSSSFPKLATENTYLQKEKPTQFHIIDSLFPIPIEIPYTKNINQITSYSGFSLHYNEKHEQANWVAYRLNQEKLVKRINRTNNFEIDPKIKSGSANNEDYKGSGYDRGHLVPAADMAWSLNSMSESFLFSNISPQDRKFNSGIWKNLEDTVRQWALNKGEIYIVTGPIFHSGLNRIGKNKVSVPELFYKVILDLNSDNPQAIGFIIPNAPSIESIRKYAVSIDSVEKATGLDFYFQLEDSLENKLESNICQNCWFNFRKSKMPTPNYPDINICKGINPDGKQCKNMAGKNKNYCRLHLPK